MASSLLPSLEHIEAEIRRRSRANRDVRQRRKYATDPWGYFHDVLGCRLTPQQEAALALILRHPRVLVPAAQNVGKTHLLGGAGCWRFDCHGALPDEKEREQGCRLLLLGPDASTVEETIWQAILLHVKHAEERGYGMPGVISERSILWYVPGRPGWRVEGLHPSIRVGRGQAHTASGRHHRCQHLLVEEGAGVDEQAWRAGEGTCSGEGNTIVSAYNPTEPSGPAISREQGGVYVVMRLSALDHPNVRERREVVPGAISHTAIDALVRTGCTDQGPHPGTPIEPGDFPYALPPSRDALDPDPRQDGYAGHAEGALRVYRPGPVAEVSILGKTASAAPTGLFSSEMLEASFQRWGATVAPSTSPDRVGVDPARMGTDNPVAAPAWGRGADALLRAYAEAQEAGPEAVARLLESGRARIGQLVTLQRGDGPTLATELWARWYGIPQSIDDGGPGASVIDHGRRVIGAEVEAVTFGGRAPTPPPGIPYCENMRTWLYVTTARLCAIGLLDLPPDDRLRQQFLAHSLKVRSMSVKIGDRTRRVSSVLLSPKDDVKAIIGHSPDEADAVVCALVEGVVFGGAAALDPMNAARGMGLRANYSPRRR